MSVLQIRITLKSRLDPLILVGVWMETGIRIGIGISHLPKVNIIFYLSILYTLFNLSRSSISLSLSPIYPCIQTSP
jgi:hypothetical protein